MAERSNDIRENRFFGELEDTLNDVRFGVNRVEPSTLTLPTSNCAYFNLTTKEQNSYCIELSIQGFRIVGKEYDKNCEHDYSEFYETIYALLDTISPAYRNAFGEALAAKLELLEGERKEQPHTDSR